MARMINLEALLSGCADDSPDDLDLGASRNSC